MIRVLITGWRAATIESDYEPIANGLTAAVSLVRLVRNRADRTVVLVHGNCSGVDRIASGVARRLGWTVEAHPAIDHPHMNFGPWPAAGPRRNEYMVRLGADVVLGMPGPGSRGTVQCVGIAMRAGLMTLVMPITRNTTPAKETAA